MNEIEYERHVMEPVEVYPAGSVQWACTHCERRFLMQTKPRYKKIVMVSGDEGAVHVGSNGAVSAGRLDVSTGTDKDDVLSDDLRDALDDFFNGLDAD